MKTTLEQSQHVLYTVGVKADAVPVVSHGCVDMHQSAVLLGGSDGEPVDATLEHGQQAQQLQQLVGSLALDRSDVSSPKLSKNVLVISFDEAREALYEHFGNTGSLLTPLAALQLAGAVKMARTQKHDGLLFTAGTDSLDASPQERQLFMARARRRQSEQTFGRPLTPWPCR
ncbi:MAG: hypothetical protein JWO35_425 [Candidatus Saccharibacteria bacterium]|nr:hypothetical protein [Candidatus Saccharibacteria bacterium]